MSVAARTGRPPTIRMVGGRSSFLGRPTCSRAVFRPPGAAHRPLRSVGAITSWLAGEGMSIRAIAVHLAEAIAESQAKRLRKSGGHGTMGTCVAMEFSSVQCWSALC